MAYMMAHPIAAQATESARAAFMRRTYTHLAGAIGAFVVLEYLLFSMVSQFDLEHVLASLFRSPASALFIFVAFIGISFLATWWASSGASPVLQYAGLSLYVVVEAMIFVPILYVIQYRLNNNSEIIPTAGILTMCMFGGLTTAALVTRKDFSFLAPILSIGGFLIMGVIICAMIFPGSLHLGVWFSLLMIVFASASILYQTSNVLHHYRTDQHVAAALALFAAVATLFYYILRLMMQMRSSD